MPNSPTTPPSTTATASAPLIVLSLCAMTMEVLPAIIASRAWFTSRSDSASSALVASSRSSTFGLHRMALAMAMRCFCPPLSLIPRSPTHVSRPLSNPRMKSATLACSNASMIAASLASARPNVAFARIDRANSTGSWLTTPIIECRCRWSTSFTQTPATVTVPR